jgi:7-carboxy-7-deazaguanine synthase
MINITEIFNSLQGEGPFAGRPATFIRLCGCIEPYCPWCDSKHAWKEGKDLDPDTISWKIAAFNTPFLVITGGEPFLQWNHGLKELEKRLVDEGYEIQYETSGRILIPESSMGYKVCFPKFLNNRWHFDDKNIDRADVFKFVFSDDGSGIKEFVHDRGIASEQVWIMPLGAHRAEQLALMPSAWEFCTKNKFNFSPRLHTLAFDDQNGI